MAEVGSAAFGTVVGWAGAGVTPGQSQVFGVALAAIVVACEVRVLSVPFGPAMLGVVAGALARTGVEALIVVGARRNRR